MRSLASSLNLSPVMLRVAPFAIFLILTQMQSLPGGNAAYWMYAAKTALGACMVWAVYPLIAEMRWKFSWEGLAAGILVFALWVGLDPLYPKMGGSPTKFWNPNDAFGEGSALALFFIAVRILGSTLVVPPLEEVFYRSFIYRYLVNPDFQSVPLNLVKWGPLLITAAVFGATHYQWLAGILCGLIYHGLVLRKNRLGDAMFAHAVTNLLLGIWVVWKGDWKFW